ncbi:MAG TPA: hypothetical protein VES39_11435 [Rhodospirillales bacterium]|nr:hypothetical protein [Rhodospirillales bacterium]
MNTSLLSRLVVVAAIAAGTGFTAFPSTVAAAPAAGDDPSCVMLLPEAGGMLVNRCGGCREVTLERLRAGESIPNIRAMMLPGAAATPSPFRGPGRTRIVGERACPRPPGRGAQQAAFVR